jgi:hypothetical protein
MKQKTVVTLITLSWLMSHIAGAQAYTYVLGWNFIRAYNCYGFQSGGVDYMYTIQTRLVDRFSHQILQP